MGKIRPRTREPHKWNSCSINHRKIPSCQVAGLGIGSHMHDGRPQNHCHHFGPHRVNLGLSWLNEELEISWEFFIMQSLIRGDALGIIGATSIVNTDTPVDSRHGHSFISYHIAFPKSESNYCSFPKRSQRSQEPKFSLNQNFSTISWSPPATAFPSLLSFLFFTFLVLSSSSWQQILLHDKEKEVKLGRDKEEEKKWKSWSHHRSPGGMHCCASTSSHPCESHPH